MNKDQADAIAKDALDKLTEALEGGRSEELVRYLRTMARFHQYSFGNVLLIATQKPDATQVAGFHAWRKLGRFVRKGEKGIGIIAPLVGKKDNAEGEACVRGFRVVHVFDVSQTDGDALPGIRDVSGDPGAFTPTLRSIITGKGISLTYVEDLGGALGCSKGGAIEVKLGLTPAEEFLVLAHELGHELLHRRDDPSGRPSRDVRELEAEAVAFAVSSGIGLDASGHSADYIGLYQGSKDLLLASLDRVQKVAAEILSGLVPASADPEKLAA